MTQTPVLITTTGPDKPGVSSVLFAVLTRHDVDVSERPPLRLARGDLDVVGL